MRGLRSPLLMHEILMITGKIIRKLVEEKIKGTDKFIVEIKVKPEQKVYVFIDGDQGVSVEDCIQISRFITSRLDRDIEDFELNVSSAGLDFPFSMRRQYQKNTGKIISVLLLNGEKIKGTLLNVRDDGIVMKLSPDKKKKGDTVTEQISLQYDQIKEARNVISFRKEKS